MIKVIVIDGELRDVIRDGWGRRPACTGQADRGVVDFRRRPGSDEPNAQMFEDVPEDRRVFDTWEEKLNSLRPDGCVKIPPAARR